jgi:regulator of sigma E protease
MVLTIAAAIFVFGLLVFVHELGHFLAAKATGMKVNEFAIGFGPKLCAVQKGETVYSIRAFPLGGFNDIAGMFAEDDSAGPRGYAQKSVGARLIVMLAGSAMNLALPVLLFFGLYFFIGVGTPNPEPVVGSVMANHPAAAAGLQKGDRVLAVNGQEVTTWKQLTETLSDELSGQESQAVTLTIERGGETMEKTIDSKYSSLDKKRLVGVVEQIDYRTLGAAEAFHKAVQTTGKVIYRMCYELYKITLALEGKDLAGPVGIAQMAGQVAEMGIVPLLNFTAFLSLNLGIINLFPIPALDGGHVIGLCFEAIVGRPLSEKYTVYVQLIGITLVVMLMIYATKNDVMRVFFGG